MITSKIFEVSGGYGYDILIDGKLFIRQPHVPAIGGMVIMTRTQAENMAALVIDKLNDKRTVQENEELQTLLQKDTLTEQEKARAETLSNKENPTVTVAEAESIVNG